MFRFAVVAPGFAVLAIAIWLAASWQDRGGSLELPPPSCDPQGSVRVRIDEVDWAGDSIRTSFQITPAVDLEGVSIRLGRGIAESAITNITSLGRGAPLRGSVSTTLAGLPADRFELRVYATIAGVGEPVVAIQPLNTPAFDLRDAVDGAPLLEVWSGATKTIEVPALRDVGDSTATRFEDSK